MAPCNANSSGKKETPVTGNPLKRLSQVILWQMEASFWKGTQKGLYHLWGVSLGLITGGISS